jgi:hypothetical protein
MYIKIHVHIQSQRTGYTKKIIQATILATNNCPSRYYEPTRPKNISI